MSESRNARAGCDNWLNDAPLSCLSQLLDRVAAALDKLQAANKKVLLRKGGLVFYMKTSNEQFQGNVTDLIAKISEQAASNVAAARFLCRDRAKLLDAQVDVLSVSVGQLRASVAGGNLALKQGHLVGLKRAFLAATAVKELCKLKLKPCVSAKVDIATNVYGVLGSLEGMTKIRLYDVDASKSVVSGTGLVSCFVKLGAVNELKTTCVNSSGEATDWVTVKDVSVIVRSLNGEVIGRKVGGEVVGKGDIMIMYEADDAYAEEIEVDVNVGGVVLLGSPWRVVVVNSAIKVDAVHLKTNHLNGTGSYGVVVALDGLHLAVSNFDTHSLSVYSTDTVGRILTFGSYGSGAGQFHHPSRMCATPRGTILVSEYGNKRLQEVTWTGEHVRFFDEGHFDGGSVFGLRMQGDVVAVGKHGSGIDERVVLLSYSSGVLIRKFGVRGSSEGQIKDVFGLDFTPDGKHILVADWAPQLSMFTVDGVFVKTIGSGVLHSGWNDVLCSGSNIFVVDSSMSRICVFSAETGAFIRTWGTRGKADGQFDQPVALAAHKNKLFVSDARTSRVQIFK